MKDLESSRKLLHIFPSLEVGGIQRRFVQIANEIGTDDNHIVFAADGNYEALDLLTERARFAKLEDLIGPVGNSRLSIFKALRCVRPNLLVTYNWGAIEWAAAGRILKMSHIHHEDGFGPEENQRQYLRRIWARRLVLHGASQVVVPSRQLQEIAQNDWKIPEGHLLYMPNGVDTRRFGSNRSRGGIHKLGVPQSDLYMGTVAALRREKNLFRLIESFSKVAEGYDVRLLIVGTGPQYSQLKSYAESTRCADRIHFLGQQSSPEHILCGLDIFALSSDTEQMPISVLEAMSSGLPVVCTQVGDVCSMVSENNRPFVEARDADGLAEAMKQLLASEVLRQQLGQENRRKVVADFSLERMVSRYEELYEKSASPKNA